MSQVTQNPSVQESLRRVAREARLTPVLETRLLEIAEGLTYDQIARWHGISLNTVKTEVSALLRALGARCCHEIQDAVTAARARADDGASADELYRFLLLRFE
jgi:DNA-binding NarL/FixJ family response regulator